MWRELVGSPSCSGGVSSTDKSELCHLIWTESAVSVPEGPLDTQSSTSPAHENEL